MSSHNEEIICRYQPTTTVADQCNHCLSPFVEAVLGPDSDDADDDGFQYQVVSFCSSLSLSLSLYTLMFSPTFSLVQKSFLPLL